MDKRPSGLVNKSSQLPTKRMKRGVKTLQNGIVDITNYKSDSRNIGYEDQVNYENSAELVVRDTSSND